MAPKSKKTGIKKKSVEIVKKGAKKRNESIQSTQINIQSHRDAYRRLQLQIDTAWKNLQDDVKKNASSEGLIQDKNYLLLLLGECNYMTRECMKLSKAKKEKFR